MSNLKIVDYRDDLKSKFVQFNREWLEKYFSVEKVDETYFADPKGTIIDLGGEIFFAEYDGEIVGVAALIPSPILKAKASVSIWSKKLFDELSCGAKRSSF